MAKRKCNVCDFPVDLENLHPNSLEVPTNEKFSASHYSCSEDEANQADFGNENHDDRGWITTFGEKIAD